MFDSHVLETGYLLPPTAASTLQRLLGGGEENLCLGASFLVRAVLWDGGLPPARAELGMASQPAFLCWQNQHLLPFHCARVLIWLQRVDEYMKDKT